jgi:uncharacterized membrane protein YphA (DoxX/SURF4 family)
MRKDLMKKRRLTLVTCAGCSRSIGYEVIQAMRDRLQTLQSISKFALGLMAFLAGLDKFLNLLTNWEQYVSPLAQKMLPLSPTSLMHVVGVIEMVVGLAILTKATRLGAYVASAWLVCIALALVTTGHFFDVAVRDLELAVAAFVLAQLTEIRESSAVETQDMTRRLRTDAA